MKASNLIAFAAGAGACLALYACGGDSGGGTGSGPPTSSAPPPQNLGTSDVLAKAKFQSETQDPFNVNDGQVTLTGTDEVSDPVSIDN